MLRYYHNEEIVLFMSGLARNPKSRERMRGREVSNKAAVKN